MALSPGTRLTAVALDAMVCLSVIHARPTDCSLPRTRISEMTMWTFVLPAVLSLMLSAGVQVRSPASGNECPTCHLRLVWTQSATAHVDLWITSKHAVSRVGCEKCHGGDPKTTDERAAHRGVVNSANRSSPVNGIALPLTCGRCHRAPARFWDECASEAVVGRRPDGAHVHVVSHLDGNRGSVTSGTGKPMPALPSR